MKHFLTTLLAAAIAISASADDQRAAYAYGLQATPGADGAVTFSFNVTSPTCTGAKLVFTDGEGKSFDLALMADPTAQVNFEIPAFSDVASAFGLSGEISWGVEISSTVPGTEPIEVLRGEGYNRDANDRCYGGVAVITDPEYPSFGTAMVYTETRNSVTAGIELIDPKLNVTVHFRDSEDAGFTAINSQCIPFERLGRFIISSWSDAGSGLYMYDPTTPDVLPVQMFQGDRDASNGLFTNNGVQVGGSVPAACASLDGMSIYTFDEDITNPADEIADHVFARYDIGNEWTIASAPDWFSTSVVTYSASSGKQESSRPVNNSCNNFAVTPWGIMIGQARWSNGALYPSYFFWNPENDKILSEYTPAVCADMVSSGGSVAINGEYNLLARAGYTGNTGDITVHAITWEDVEGGKAPVIGELKWTCPAQSAANVLRFDYAGNLYLYDRYHAVDGNHAYSVYAFPGNYVVTTPCRSDNKVSVVESGVNSIAVDCAGVASYYDMSGRAVDASNLGTGVYIKLVNGKATKVVVK